MKRQRLGAGSVMQQADYIDEVFARKQGAAECFKRWFRLRIDSKGLLPLLIGLIVLIQSFVQCSQQ